MTPRIEEPMEERKYRPSNGTEGYSFIDTYCMNCIHEKFSHTQCHKDKQCEILNESMIEGEVDQWVYDTNGQPKCTEYQHWDWGNDDDGWNEPEEPIPVSPNQLVMPFAFEELENQTFKVVPDYEWDIN